MLVHSSGEYIVGEMVGAKVGMDVYLSKASTGAGVQETTKTPIITNTTIIQNMTLLFVTKTTHVDINTIECMRKNS